MKKIFSLIIAAACIASLTGCQAVNSDAPSRNDRTAVSEDNPQIKQTVLFDENDIVVTAQEIDYTDDGIDVSVQIENKSKEMVDADIENLSVNDYMMQNPLGGTVNPGNKKFIHIWLDPNVLSICGIKDIADIEFEVCFRYSKDREEYIRTPRLRVETSAFETHKYSFDDKGTVVYEKDNLKIVSKNVISKGFYQYGPSVLFYVENNSDGVYHIMFDDVSVNDTMIYPFGSVCSIIPGKHAIMGLSFEPRSLNEIGIDAVESINTVQCCFTILKNELYFSTGNDNDTELITVQISDVIK